MARELRGQLNLSERDRLDVRALAEHVELEIVKLRQITGHGLSADGLAHLTRRKRGVFSAACLAGPEVPPFILINESHRPTRQASDITHECAHRILGHELGEVFDDHGCRKWDPVQEDQAHCLAGALLVPRDGAIWALQSGMSMEEGARHFGVSIAMFRMRVNATGVAKQLNRRKALFTGA